MEAVQASKQEHSDCLATLTSEINRLLADGEESHARSLLEQLASLQPRSPQPLLMAALIARQQGDLENAFELLNQNLGRNPTHFETLYNRALLELEIDESQAAATTLRKLIRLYPGRADLYNDLGVSLSDHAPIKALAAFAKAMRIDPKVAAPRNSAMELCISHGWLDFGLKMLQRQAKSSNLTSVAKAEIAYWQETIQNTKQSSQTGSDIPEEILATKPFTALKGKKILFLASHESFLADIVNHLKHDNTVVVSNESRTSELRELIKGVDLIWLEWCDQLAIAVSWLPKSCPIICRLHSYEVFTDMPQQVNWNNIDHLLFVNRSVQELFRRSCNSHVEQSVIHNGVDIAKFGMPANKPCTKKIASVGYINYKKNPALLLHAFKMIYEYDAEYSLHIAGEHQDPRIALYFENFLQRHPLPVHFDGWISDMPAWYHDKSFVISTSLFESFHYSIAEGMSAGVLPLIHDWYGADLLYPEEFLFADPQSALELLKRLEQGNRPAMQRENRDWIISRYESESKLNDISLFLESILSRTESNGLRRG